MKQYEIYKALVEYSPDLYIIYSDGDCIEFAAAGKDFKKLFPLEKIIGKRASDILPSPVRELMVKGIEKCKLKNRTIRGHFPINKGGEVRYNEIRFIPQSDNKVLGIISDVTDIEQIKKEKAKAESQLKEHLTLLEDIVFSLSHELREPLRSISGFSSLLRRRWHVLNEEDRDEHLQLIEQSASKMSKQIKALTTLLHLPELKRTDEIFVDKLFQAIEAELEESFSKKIEFIVDLNSVQQLKSSYSLLYMLFYQLLHNSISFRHPDRKPHIQVHISEGVSEYLITIIDNGQGIEVAYQEQVFSLFKQLDYRHKYEGAGIGLTLVRHIMTTLEGNLEMKSVWNQGTEIAIRIPQPNED